MKRVLFSFLLVLFCRFANAQTYCTPLYFYYGSGMTGGTMSNFKMIGYSGSVINDTFTDSAVITDYADETKKDTIILQPGESYPDTIAYYKTVYDGYGGNEIWIDFNDDGIFADSEAVTATFPASYGVILFTTSSLAAIPSTAPPGYHRMRVRNIHYTSIFWWGETCYCQWTPLDPCKEYDISNAYGNGVTADYTVNISALLPCSGKPVAGSISGPKNVCSGTGVTLSVTEDSTASGLTYQWYFRAAGTGSFISIPGATGLYYTASSIISDSDYIFIATCKSSGLSDSTPVFTISLYPSYVCYCSPNTGVTLNLYNSTPIDSVAILSTTLDNYTPTDFALYSLYFPVTSTTTANLFQDGTYTIAVNSNGSANYTADMWIDYNHNGKFDTTEYTQIVLNAFPGDASYASFTIPAAADTGYTGMRIRVAPQYLVMYSVDACTTESYGSTADYVVHIGAGKTCTGLPAAGTISSNMTNVCSANTFDVLDSGYTIGLGISYQWYSSSVDSTKYNAISGATATSYSITGQADSTKYILVTTCSSSGKSDTSNKLIVAENPFFTCYCSPNTGTILDNNPYFAALDSVAIGSTTLNNYTPGAYSLYTEYYPVTASTTTATLKQYYCYTIFVNAQGPDNYNAAAWIDYNHDGIFEKTEYISIATNALNNTVSFASFYVPATADTGITGMRVRVTDVSFPIIDSVPCANEPEGTVQDYVINIQPGSHCSGTPTAGTPVSSVSGICAGYTFDLTSIGYSTGIGITYQWLYSLHGKDKFGIWPGATTPVFTTKFSDTTDYEFVVTCDSGTSDTSAIITVNRNPFYLCYCSPLLGGYILDTTATHSPIDSFSIAGTPLNNYTPGSTSAYNQYWLPTDSTTANLYESEFYEIAVKSENSFGEDYAAGMWIDYNHNGTFDSVEFTSLAKAVISGNVLYGSLIIPAGSDTGLTGMRIRVVPASYGMSPSSSCKAELDGAVQDYIVNITLGSPCADTPKAGVAVSSVTSACPYQVFSINDTGYSMGIGIAYRWESSPSGLHSFKVISGATSVHYIVVNQDSATDYRLIVTCSASGISDTSNIVTVTESPFYNCYCSDSSLSVYAGYTLINNVSISGTTLNITTPHPLPYVAFPETGDSTAIFQRTLDYKLSMSVSGGFDYAAGAWIDYNRNGVYDSSEYIKITDTTVTGDGTSISFHIPATADTGITGMRIRVTAPLLYGMGDTDACTGYYYSQTYDFSIKIEATNCSGVPVAGGAYASTGEACSSTSITLADTGYTEVGGLEWQWQSSGDSTTWTNISGATTSYYKFTGMAATTFYRCLITCKSSGISDSTNIVKIPFMIPCYCDTPEWYSGVPLDIAMDDFTLAGYAGTSISDAGILSDASYANGYLDRTGTMPPIKLQQQGVYSGAVVYNTPLNLWENQVWIDFNDDGIFADSEVVTRVFGFCYTTVTSDTAFTLSIPLHATPGLHRLRMRNVVLVGFEGIYTERLDPCAKHDTSMEKYFGGAVVDYMAYIIPLPCSGKPFAGKASSGMASVCPSQAFVLTDSGYTSMEGVVKQWFSSPSGAGSFTAIPGATAATYTISSQTAATDYIFIVTCDSSGMSDTSNIVTVTESSFDSCYCSPLITGTKLVKYGSEKIILNTVIPGTTMDAPESLPDSTGFIFVSPVPSYNTATLVIDTTYVMADTIDNKDYAVADVGMWIDYNHSGTFDAEEYTELTNHGSYWAANFTIPSAALTGATGMRIASSEYSMIDSSGSCSEITNGEVEDYIITIITGACDTVLGLNSGSITDSSAIIFWESIPGSAGYQYIIDTTPSSPSVAGIPVADTSVNALGLVPGATYYAHVRTACPGGVYSKWVTLPFTTLPCVPVAGLGVTGIGYTAAVISWDGVGGAEGYQYVINDSGTAPSVAGTFIAATTLSYTSLSAATTYYAHVRTVCPDGGLSGWETISFTTLSCVTVSKLSATGITDTSATITWTGISGTSGYQYIVDTSSSVPSGTGTFVSEPSAYTTGLQPGTIYYAHVRTECTDSLFSGWVTIPFTTYSCDTVLDLTYSVTTASVITISWNSISGALGYQYVVNDSLVAPSGAGISVSDTSVGITGLLSATTYYAHVRTICAGGASGWVTISFTTPPCDTISKLLVTAITDTSATIVWSALYSYSGYQFVINDSAAAPSDTGIFVSTTTAA